MRDEREPEESNADQLKKLRALRATASGLRLEVSKSDVTYQEVKWDWRVDADDLVAKLANLETAINDAIADIPKTKAKKSALRVAAIGLAYLHEVYECPPPVFSNQSDAVCLLRSICERAGLHYSAVHFKNALRAAVKHRRCPECCSNRSEYLWVEDRLRRSHALRGLRLGSLRFFDEQITFQIDT